MGLLNRPSDRNQARSREDELEEEEGSFRVGASRKGGGAGESGVGEERSREK